MQISIFFETISQERLIKELNLFFYLKKVCQSLIQTDNFFGEHGDLMEILKVNTKPIPSH